MALDRGFITPDQLRNALSDQARDLAENRSEARALGDILVAKGYLSDDQLLEVLSEQKYAEMPTALIRAPQPPRAKPAARQPVRLGKYSLLRELGRGGNGVVYEAVDTELSRRVALKTMIGSSSADPKNAAHDEERFLREARLSANLARHPHVVSVYEAGVIDGKRYIAMEFIQGRQMDQWRRKAGSVTIRDQVALLRDVALAVHQAHEQGVFHRDLKPANIMVDANNQPHITDFGLAKVEGQSVSVSLTAAGMVVGTPIYMSPEQAQGRRDIDKRTDIWSMGIMLYEILTGHPPFRGETPIAILMKVVKDPVPLPSAVLRGVPHPAVDKAIENICLKALAKKPKQRHGTALGFADDLTRWLNGEFAAPARSSPPTRRMVIRPRKSYAWLWATLGIAASLAVAAFLFLDSSRSRGPTAELSRPKSATPPAPVAPKTSVPEPRSGPPPRAPAVPNSPDTAPHTEASARQAINAAREIEKSRPDDFTGIREAWVKAAWASERTPLLDEARAHLERVDKARPDFLLAAFVKFNDEIRALEGEARYGEALAKLGEARVRYGDSSWSNLISTREDEIKSAAAQRLDRTVEEARRALDAGQAAKAREILLGIKKWRLPDYDEKADELVAQVDASVPDPAPIPGKPAVKPPPPAGPVRPPPVGPVRPPAADVKPPPTPKAPAAARGTILREYWTGVGGALVEDLTRLPNFPDSPSGSDLRDSLETPQNWGDNYGTRLRGFVHPPMTGAYVFWIASDDQSELWLSTDHNPLNKRKIAGLAGAVGYRAYEANPSGKAAAVNLSAGRRYYIEALQKEGGGDDHLSVGWQLPDGTMERSIPGSRLSPWSGGKSAPEPALNAGLVGHWPLDETAGPTATDRSGRRHAGQLMGQCSWGQGKTGGALAFNGTDAYVSVADAPDLQITGDMSIACWLKVESVTPDWVRVVGKGTGNLRNYGLWLGEGGGRTILWQQYDGSGKNILGLTSRTQLPIGTWCHVAGVVRGSEAFLYLNGIVDATGGRSGTPATNADPLTFAYGAMHAHLRGALDDIRVYSRALTALEVLSLARPTEASLQGNVGSKDGRPLPPEPPTMREAEKLVQERIKDEPKKTAADRQALALKLLRKSREEEADSPIRFVLLSEARELAAKSGDATTALAAVDELAAAFSVDAFDLKAKALATVASSVKTPEALESMANLYMSVASDAVTWDEYDAAISLSSKAETMARGAQKDPLVGQIQSFRSEVGYIQKEYIPVKSILKVLEERPDDPAANLAVGKFLCFVKGDWSAGLPLLSKGSDGALKVAADGDLARPRAPEDQSSIADRWWDIAQKEEGVFKKNRIRERAITWYEECEPRLTGALKAKVVRQIESYAPSSPYPAMLRSEDWGFEDPASKVAFSCEKEASGKWVIKAAIDPYGKGRTSLVYPRSKQAGWHISGAKQVAFWIRYRNQSKFGWQGPNPIVTLYETPTKLTTLTPAGNALGDQPENKSRPGWKYFEIPLAGNEKWVPSGQPLRKVNWVTLAVDSWDDVTALTLWLDGLTFK